MNLIEKYRAFKGRSRVSRKIFVLGCGRSGTHWVGRILDSHPEIAATIEIPAIFGLVKRMALDETTRPQLMTRLVARYRWAHAKVAPLHYADKSHPVMWFAEELAAAFPNCRFIGIQRSVHGTIASMLKHERVMDWYSRWREFPVPNHFLGITEQNSGDYEALPATAKCALRWESHRERMLELQRTLSDRMLLLNYEEMIGDISEHQLQMQDFLGLKSPFPEFETRTESLDRWKEELSPEDLETIRSTLEINR